jgi:hypothetical protein
MRPDPRTDESTSTQLAIWYILQPFGNKVAIWNIFPRVGILCQEESGNTAVCIPFCTCHVAHISRKVKPAALSRVARFLLTEYTKTGKNIPYFQYINIKMKVKFTI